jgi:hypothetical protein
MTCAVRPAPRRGVRVTAALAAMLVSACCERPKPPVVRPAPVILPGGPPRAEGTWLSITWYPAALLPGMTSVPDYIPLRDPPVVMVYVEASANLVGRTVHFTTQNGSLTTGDEAVLQPSAGEEPSFAWFQTVFEPHGDRTGFVTVQLDLFYSSIRIPVYGPPVFHSFIGHITPNQHFELTVMTDGELSGCVATLSRGSGLTVRSPDMAGVLLDAKGSSGWVNYTPPLGTVSPSDWAVFNIDSDQALTDGGVLTVQCQDVYQQVGTQTIEVSASAASR